MEKSLLTKEEIERIILATAGGPKGATEAEITVALNWAHQVRTEESILSLVLAGALRIVIQKGQVCFLPVPEALRKVVNAGS